MNTYKLTAITFPTFEDACNFVNENIDNWVEIDVNGVNQSYEIVPTNNGDITTVVFAKKTKKQAKEVTRTDCNNLINELGKDWAAVCVDGNYTLQHSKNGRTFKGIKAKSYRGLLRVIRNLDHSYNAACINHNQTAWLRQYGIIA